MSGGHFGDRLLEAVESKRSHVVVGLDPEYDSLPPEVLFGPSPGPIRDDTEMKVACYRDFLSELLPALVDEAAAVKIQIAYFEALGARGYALYEEMVRWRRVLAILVIADVKRGDIGSTAEAYAQAHLDVAGADAVTVNPYFGSDGLEPFFRRCREEGKGVFVLVKTSNPSSAEIQDVSLESGEPVYARVADLVEEWGRDTVGARGYRSIGAVVGGTHPEQGALLRRRLSGVPFLIPGYGAQGATAGRSCRSVRWRRAPGRWSIRPAPSCTPTGRPRAVTGSTPRGTRRSP